MLRALLKPSSTGFAQETSTNTTYVTEFNQLVFDILMNACDEEALDIVLRYERSDNGSQQVKKDGRRALVALMQTYSPVSTNAGNNAKAKLEATRFKQDKNTINQQITDFYINVAILEAARDKKLETLELWALHHIDHQREGLDVFQTNNVHAEGVQGPPVFLVRRPSTRVHSSPRRRSRHFPSA